MLNTPTDNKALFDSTIYSNDISKKAFSHPVEGMNNEELDLFIVGRSFFTIPWVEAPAATTARDGLGPLFSANTCKSCHPGNGAGVAIDEQDAMRRDLVLRLARFSGSNLNNVSKMKMGFTPDPIYGAQLSVNGTHDTPYEGYSKVSYKEESGVYKDGTPFTLRVPTYSIEQLQYGTLHKETVISPRIALALVGLGAIEKIPQEAILKHEDVEDRDGDGISGKANWVISNQSEEKELGRFTWKASSPSVIFQSASAASNDMGLTSPYFPKENCSEQQTECLEAVKGRHEFDLPQERLEAIAFYLKHLKIPQPRDFERKTEAQSLFNTLTCNRCHVERYTTSDGADIAPYSDFLLHDMGEKLSDGHPDFLATGSEWRTPPLWGIGLYKSVSGEANYLHDGRARSIEEAILWHGGEAENAKEAFMALKKEKRQLLVDYLGTI